MKNRNSRIAVASSVLSIAFSPTVAMASPEEAVQTYREFLEARDDAESIQELYRFMLSRQVDQLKALPEETVASMGESVLSPPNADQLRAPKGDFDLVSSTRDGDELTLALEAVSEEDGVRESLRRKVKLVEEADGWKITNPTPGSWRVTGRMPTDMSAVDLPKKPGPAAKKWNTKFSGGAGELELVAEAVITEHNSAADDFMHWDPRGHFLAVGDGDGMTYLALPDLESLWVSKAKNGGSAYGTISADSKWQAITPSSNPAFLPLAFSLEKTPPADEYYFIEPAYAALAETSGRASVRRVQFNPAEPVIAIVNQGTDGHTISFQPTQSFIDDEADSKSLEQWPLDVSPGKGLVPAQCISVLTAKCFW